MNLFSFFLHENHIVSPLHSHVALCIISLTVCSCYSFRGGSVPSHLKTVSIASVVDKSAFGDATLREYCTEAILKRFRSDNSLQVVEDNGDARLTPTLVRIQDQILTLQSKDLEDQRKIVVAVEVEYVDAVKNKVVWKRSFENYSVYNIANATEERSAAARTAIDRIAEDILLAVVAEW